jgi:transcription antitermination factor NusG
MTLKPSDNPPSCYPEGVFDLKIGDAGPWWVARTKSRQEKALAWDLKKSGVKYYLPFVPRQQRCRRRLRMSLVPLFPGYLFFRGTVLEWQRVLRTGRIAQVLEVKDQGILHKQLSDLSLVMAAQERPELCDLVKKRRKARIVYGPFAGVEGIVEQLKNKVRLILCVDAINLAVRVEIDIDQVRFI